MAQQLIELFPKHHTYVEPFCGSAQVFFAKTPSRLEVLNDLDGEVFTFLRVCQHHCDELLRCLKHAVVSRQLFEAYQSQDPRSLTEIQRAARFLYLQRTAWGGHRIGQHYARYVGVNQRMWPTTIAEVLSEASKRLAGVQLENSPYEKVLEWYDAPDTLFFCDPPYVDMPYYRHNFAGSDFREMAKRLARIKGKFVLSINVHPEARRAFGQFLRHPIRTRYSRGTKRHATEWLFSNFPLKRIRQAP